eukprot:TRINITY_DN6574_c0_g1_i1.p1 TRINITY_DN6574_c0_g1~~TRINITY_DN6574_c0_g1_i1.p1  ORF type:complete len:2432 (+),score=758.04 TRINITY_DN6574_c0_g1_i1:122-7417(+)
MAVSLKIFMVSKGVTKTMRFPSDMSISEVVVTIREKTQEGGADHGMFQPTVPGKSTGRWLQPDRTIQFYDLFSGTELHYKKKHRPLKVRLLDGAVKTILVDESLIVSDLVENVGEKIGIKNPEEFSLQMEGAQKSDWLNPNKTLVENEVPEDVLVLLKKKFFFNDANVDRSDPVELHLLYVQCKDQIMEGVHPTQRTEAIDLSAMQCQVEYNNFQPGKHKPGFLELRKFMPEQWTKDKKVERLIYQEWKKLVGMSDINAKYRYVQLCRSLKTYGITTFHVKEKAPGKQGKRGKLIDVLFGVTRDSVLRMDAATKEVYKQYPLTHVKRWAAAEHTFTCDFGDYEDDYLVVKTLEGDQISQLIAGYIDIILKRRRDGPRMGIEDSSEKATEESVAPVRAQATQMMTTAMGNGGMGPNGFNDSMMNPAQNMHGMNGMGPDGYYINGDPSQGYAEGMSIDGQAYVMDLDSAYDATQQFLMDINTPAMPGMYEDFTPEDLMDTFSGHLRALGQATGGLLGALEDTTSGKVDEMAKALALDVEGLLSSAKCLAGASDDDIDLLPGAAAVSAAVAHILKVTQHMRENPDDPNGKLMMMLASRGLKHATMFLNASKKGDVADDGTKDLVLASGRALAEACARMCEACNDSANDDPNLLAKSAALGQWGDHLKTTTELFAPAIGQAACQTAVSQVVQSVQKAAQDAFGAFKGTDILPSSLANIGAAGKDVNESIALLLASSKLCTSADSEAFAAAAKLIMENASTLMNPKTSPQLMMESFKVIHASFGNLIAKVKIIAASGDPKSKADMERAAKALAQATSKLFATVKATAGAPTNAALRTQLKNEASQLQDLTEALSTSAARVSALMELSDVAKAVAAASMDLVTNTRACAEVSPDLRDSLLRAGRAAAMAISGLVNAVGTAKGDMKNPDIQANLVKTTRESALPISSLVSVSRASCPQVPDASKRQGLSDAAAAAAKALQSMVAAFDKLEATSGGKDMKTAMAQFDSVQSQIEEKALAVSAGLLQPLPGQTEIGASQLLSLSITRVGDALTQLSQTALTNPDDIGVAAKETAASVNDAVQAGITLATLTKGKEKQSKIIEAARAVASGGSAAVANARTVAGSPSDANAKSEMDTSIQDEKDNLERLVRATKGLDAAAIDAAVKKIRDAANSLVAGSATGEFNTHAGAIKERAKQVAACAQQVTTTAMNNPAGLDRAANGMAGVIPPLADATQKAASTAPDQASQDKILDAGRQATESSAALLVAARDAAIDRTKYRGALLDAADRVSDAIKALVGAVKPGQQQLDEAVAVLKESQKMSDPSEPVTRSVTRPLPVLDDASKRLAASTAKVISTARTSPEELGVHALAAAEAVETIVLASRAAADPRQNAVSAPASVVMAQAEKASNSASDPNQLIASVKVIGQVTASVLAAASTVNADPAVHKAILVAADKLAKNTEVLVNDAKNLSLNKPGAAQQAAASAAKVKADAAAVIRASQPIGADVAHSEESVAAIREFSKNVASAASRFVHSAIMVSDDPADKAAVQSMSRDAQAVSKDITKLVDAAMNMAPGAAEISKAIEMVNDSVSDLDMLAINVAAGVVDEDVTDKTFQVCQEEQVALCKQLTTATQNVVHSAHDGRADIGEQVLALAKCLPLLVTSTTELVSTTSDDSVQQENTQVCATVANAALGLMNAVKKNLYSASVETEAEVNAKSQEVRESLSSLVGSLKGAVMGLRECDEAIKVVEDAGLVLDKPNRSGKTYQEGQTASGAATKALVGSLLQLVRNAKKDPDNIGTFSKNIANHIPALVEGASIAAASTSDTSVKNSLIQAAKGVVSATITILEDAKAVSADSSNDSLHAAVAGRLKLVTNAISALTKEFKTGAVGELNIIAAVSKISNIVSDLDAAALFAAAGQLEYELGPNESIRDAYDQLAEKAKHLVGLSQSMDKVSAGTIEELGTTSKQVAADVADLARHTKACAGLLSSTEQQQALINEVKRIANGAQKMVSAGKKTQATKGDAASKQALAQASQEVNQSVKALVDQTQSSAGAFRNAVAEIERGAGAIRTTITSKDSGTAGATALDVLGDARGIAKATAEMLNSHGREVMEDLESGAKEVAEATVALLNNVKTVSKSAPNQEVRNSIMNCTKAAAEDTLAFFDAIRTDRPNDDNAENVVSSTAEKVNNTVVQLVAALRQLPGAEDFELEENSLESMAEQELLAAAAAIEAAAARLMSVAHVEAVPGTSLAEKEISSAILDAARAITGATKTLVFAAAETQKDIRTKSKGNKNAVNPYRKDPAWADGLISAAKQVAGTTEDLVYAANDVAQKTAGEEIIIAAVRGVSGATARLVSASRAKADPNAPSTLKLAAAAKTVQSATKMLADAAKAAMNRESMASTVVVDESAAKARRRQLEEQARIAKLEMELEKARQSVFKRRKDEYK